MEEIRSSQIIGSGLDREWVADCAKHGSATFKGSKVSLKNVRDFTWENKRDHDSKWINTKVDIDEIVDVWFVIGTSTRSEAWHIPCLPLSLVTANLSHSHLKQAEVGERYHPWNGLWKPMSCIY